MISASTSQANPPRSVAVDRQPNCCSLRTGVRRRTGVVAVALAAFFAAGFSPFATVPAAHADVEDSLGDLFLDNLSAVLAPADLGGAGASAFTTGLNTVIEQLSGSLHDQIEAAITDPVNAQLLDAINFPSVALFGRDLIGNGIEVGDPIPALGFLDQSSGPLADTFTGTNEGLLTPELSALHIDVGNLHDGGFLLGDNASSAGSTSTPADTLPPISCENFLTGPGLDALGQVSTSALNVCDGPTDNSVFVQQYYDYFIPIGSSGYGEGETSAAATATTSGSCISGIYTAYEFSFVIFPPEYTPVTPDFQEFAGGPVDITCG
jgi:hypothetical protein